MASIRKRTVTWTTDTGKARTAEKYQADYYDRAGKRHRRMFDLKKDAQRWLDEQTAGLVTGQWADPQAGRETVRAYGERWLARQVLAASTEATYEIVLRNHVFPTFGEMRMDAVNRADVQSLVKEWQLIRRLRRRHKGATWSWRSCSGPRSRTGCSRPRRASTSSCPRSRRSPHWFPSAPRPSLRSARRSHRAISSSSRSRPAPGCAAARSSA